MPNEDHLQKHAWLISDIRELKHACQKSHAKGPGGSRMCICGGCGGSPACNALSTIRDVLRGRITDPETIRIVREFL